MAEGTLFDYLEWRGDLSFRRSPLNAVDSLIFTVLAYIRFSEVCVDAPVRLSDAVRSLEEIPYEDRFRGLTFVRDKNLRFLKAVSETERFRDVLIRDCVDECSEQTEKQFAAVTFLLPEGTVFVAFRGTDNTLVGWKEDINMSFLNGTPAQLAAARYARAAAEKYNGPLFLGGHSKGGNLAVWAAASLPEETRERVVRVFNHDGPGFTEEFLAGEGFKAMVDRVLSFVPEASIVGVLMGHCDYLTIKSTNLSLMQHDPFSWQIIGRRFVYGLERTPSAKRLEKRINGLIASLTPAELELFVEKIYDALHTGNAKTLDEVGRVGMFRLVLSLPGIIRDIKSARD